MADDQFQATGNWWESATRNNNVRYESGASQSSSSGITNLGNFANWQQQQQQQQQQPDHHVAEHMKPRTSMDSGGSSVVFHDPHKLHPPDSATSTDPNLHMMGLGLSSPSMDWDQPSLLRGEKAAENSFRSMLQESGGMGLSQVQWRDPSSSANDQFKQVNKGFALDQNQFSPQYSSGDSTVTSQGLHHQSTFHQNIDSSALYGSPSSILMQGLLGPENNQQANSMNFPYPSISYGLSSNNNELVPNSWSKAPQFLRASPPKQLPPPPNNQLHFTNNAPFWNASEASAIKDVRSSYFPSSQTPFSTTPNFDVQSKNMSEVRDSGAVVKNSGSEQTHKRPRNETTPSPLPAFKVRKEKMGDRITALQQLVSPFGKTDTASVLSEAIEYIKFLHEQVTVLSNPYMKSGAPVQIQQSSGKSKEGEGAKQDLRSRGLCLVPVSSTFPVAHETTVDFWTPTFGGGSR